MNIWKKFVSIFDSSPPLFIACTIIIILVFVIIGVSVSYHKIITIDKTQMWYVIRHDEDIKPYYDKYISLLYKVGGNTLSPEVNNAYIDMLQAINRKYQNNLGANTILCRHKFIPTNLEGV